MPVIMDSYERYDMYRDTALDVIINQIRIGNIQCGRYASKLKYGVPPDEVKGWWLTNARNRPEDQKEETPEPRKSDSDPKRREPKQNLIDLLREIDRRRNRKRGD